MELLLGCGSSLLRLRSHSGRRNDWRRTAKQEAQMGLLDILTGMPNGPHGNQSQPAQKSGGMSPLMMALLGLLAYKAVTGLGGSVLSGGLGNLVKQMQENGYGRQAQSWVGHGENEAIPPGDLAKALGA